MSPREILTHTQQISENTRSLNWVVYNHWTGMVEWNGGFELQIQQKWHMHGAVVDHTHYQSEVRSWSCRLRLIFYTELEVGST